MRTIAASAARSVGRRLRERTRRGPVQPAAAPRLREHAEPVPSIPLPVASGPLAEPAEPAEPGAPEAELDALRGALVRELDRLAADDTCSASFRRAG